MSCIDPDCPQCTTVKWLVSAGRISSNGKITAVKRFSYKTEQSEAISESEKIWLGESPSCEIVDIQATSSAEKNNAK